MCHLWQNCVSERVDCIERWATCSQRSLFEGKYDEPANEDSETLYRFRLSASTPTDPPPDPPTHSWVSLASIIHSHCSQSFHKPVFIHSHSRTGSSFVVFQAQSSFTVISATSSTGLCIIDTVVIIYCHHPQSASQPFTRVLQHYHSPIQATISVIFTQSCMTSITHTISSHHPASHLTASSTVRIKAIHSSLAALSQH
jgi:hypothetical protein